MSSLLDITREELEALGPQVKAGARLVRLLRRLDCRLVRLLRRLDDMRRRGKVGVMEDAAELASVSSKCGVAVELDAGLMQVAASRSGNRFPPQPVKPNLPP